MVNSVTNRYYPSWCISQQDFATILATVAAKSLINSGSSGKKGHLYTDLKDSKLKTQRFLYTDDFSIDFFDYRRVRPANWAPPLHVTRNVKQRHRLSTGATTTARSCDCGKFPTCGQVAIEVLLTCINWKNLRFNHWRIGNFYVSTPHKKELGKPYELFESPPGILSDIDSDILSGMLSDIPWKGIYSDKFWHSILSDIHSVPFILTVPSQL